MADKQREQLAKIQRELAFAKKVKCSANGFRKQQVRRSPSFSDWTDTGSSISRLTEQPQVKIEPSSDEPSQPETPSAASKAWLGPRKLNPGSKPNSEPSTVSKCYLGMKRKVDATDLQLLPAAAPSPAISDIILKKSVDDLFCEFCQVSCSSELTMKDHVKGRKHKANLKWRQEKRNSIVGEKGSPRCDICQICCTGRVSLENHLKGKKHMAKLQQELENGADQNEKKPIRCALCLVNCMNKEAFQMHLLGKHHILRVGMACRRNI